MSFSEILVVGNLGRDPEMRYTPGGTGVTNFNVASTRQYTSNNGETVKETTWFRISVWGKQAESCNQYLKKGSKVLVRGTLVIDHATGGPKIYKTRDGGSGASFEINADTVRFLSSKGDGAGGDAGQDNGVQSSQEDNGDIPF